MQSFEGLDLAINKFKDDTSVLFLLVNTHEKLSSLQKRNIVNNYGKFQSNSVKIVFESNQDDFRTAKTFEALLPTRVIIDKHGIIRFIKYGYDGEPYKLMHEILSMIDIIKTLN